MRRSWTRPPGVSLRKRMRSRALTHRTFLTVWSFFLLLEHAVCAGGAWGRTMRRSVPSWATGGRLVRIPRIPATQSMGRLPLNPREACHPVHGKVATHARRSLPPSERSDAGGHILSLNWLFLSTGPAVCAWILLVMEFCTRCGPDERGWHRRASDLQGPHASARRGVGS